MKYPDEFGMTVPYEPNLIPELREDIDKTHECVKVWLDGSYVHLGFKRTIPDRVRCQGFTSDGTRCERTTNHESGYCYQHRKHESD